MFLHGLNTVSPPSEKSKKFYITSNANSSSGSGHGSGGALHTPSKTGGTSKSAFAKMMSWAGDMRGRLASTISHFRHIVKLLLSNYYFMSIP